MLATYAREPVDQVVFQPRIRFWYTGNHVNVPAAKHDPSWKRFDKTIPPTFFGMDLLEVHDALKASIRYCAETLGINLFNTSFKKGTDVKIHTSRDADGSSVTTHETPVGSVTERHKLTSVGGSYPIEHPVKNIEDLEVIEYIEAETEFSFNAPGFELADEVLEGRGVPQAYYRRSPFMRCVLNYLGFENTVLFLQRHKQAMLDFMAFLGEQDDAIYETIVRCPVKILDFGENIDANLVPPRYFSDYCIPYYNRRIKQLHDAGKYCHIHMDGSLKDLLPLIKDTDFDGIEAATPEPQGDVTVDELKEALGDKILQDGIPATLFMEQFSATRLEATVKRLVELFAPNLIIGVSDELPPNGQIGRFGIITRILDTMMP